MTARIATSSSSFRLDLDTPFIVTYMIGKSKIKAQALIDTRATRGNFVNAVDAERICEIEGILPIELLKPRPI